MFDPSDCQILFNRLLKDLNEVREWHDVSAEMMFKEKNETQLDQNVSLPPEELQIDHPDLSALSYSNNYLNHATSESFNFNLDDILKDD